MATKKPVRAKKPAASMKPAAKPEAPNAPRRKVVWTAPIVGLMLCVAAGGLLLAARGSSDAPARPTVMAPAMAPPSPDVSKAPEKVVEARDTAVHATAVKPVSMTGCLQRGDGGFVLKNPEGEAAPKSRSWKSGFLKRSASPVDLTDASNAAHLGDHVGQRVSVTGTVVDRDMRVPSLHRVAASCGA
jgi:hypothetical protein